MCQESILHFLYLKYLIEPKFRFLGVDDALNEVTGLVAPKVNSSRVIDCILDSLNLSIFVV